MPKKLKFEGRTGFWKMHNGHIMRAPDLTDAESNFFRKARRMFLENWDWDEFENFAFGMKSPLYMRKGRGNPTKAPLYIILKDMWLRLGIKQGQISKSKKKKG